MDRFLVQTAMTTFPGLKTPMTTFPGLKTPMTTFPGLKTPMTAFPGKSTYSSPPSPRLPFSRTPPSPRLSFSRNSRKNPSAPSAFDRPPITEVLEKIASGTVFLQSSFYHGGLLLARCISAGYLVRDDGVILTCGHASTSGRRFYIDAVPQLKLYWPVYSVEACFKGQKFVEAKVLAVDLRRDLALVKIPQSVLGSDGSQNHVGKILERELMIGEPLYLMGHPHGLPYCTRFGIFSGYRSPKEFSESMQLGLSLASPPNFPVDFKYLEIDIEAPAGFSGGPVCTGDGYLAGILVSGLDASSCVNCEGAVSSLAVPATHLQRMMLFLKKKSETDGAIMPSFY